MDHLIVYSNKEKLVMAIIKVVTNHLSQINIINSGSNDMCIFLCDEPRAQYCFCNILAENVYCTLRLGEGGVIRQLQIGIKAFYKLTPVDSSQLKDTHEIERYS